MMDYKYYRAIDYPQAQFYVEHLPNKMAEVIKFLAKENEYCICGGVAFYLLTGRKGMSTDLDFIVPISKKDYLIDKFSGFASEVFLSKSTRNEDLLTLFWPTTTGFYKIDVLFNEFLPESEMKNLIIDGREISVSVVNKAWLWINKLQKVSQLRVDGTPSPKIKRHAQIVIDLGEYLLRRDSIRFPQFIEKFDVLKLGNRAKEELSERVKCFEHGYFCKIVDNVIEKGIYGNK